MNRSSQLIEKIEALQKQEIPKHVLERARQSLLDYLAVTSAGVKFQEEKLRKYMEFALPEAGDCTAIGMGKKLALKEAVFLNGLNGHALDLDDGTNAGIIHLGSPIFSLLLPLAERYDVGLDKVLEAAVIGYETSFTMAVSIQPGHKAHGFHATGTCGVLGAAIAASYLLDFTKEERFRAFATACVSATGMLKVLDGDSELKPYNVAKTALLALSSIQLAKAGFQGHNDPLGGERGFFKMMTGQEDIELKPLLLDGTYAIEKTYTKPYASCRYTHPAVEAAIQLRNENHLKAEDVQRIAIQTYALAVYGHDHREIPSSYSAKMSIPFATAVGLIYGKAGLQEFAPETIENPEVMALVEKISVTADPLFSSTFPEKQSALLEITTADGRTLTRQVDFPKGEPENPLSEDEFFNRYLGLMAYAGINHGDAEAIFRMAAEGKDSIRSLMRFL